MVHNIIRRARIVDAFRHAVALGASCEEAFYTVGQSLGLDVQTVEWCVGEDEETRVVADRAQSDKGVQHHA